jgi:hypothetical protein
MMNFTIEEKLRTGHTASHTVPVPQSWNECDLRQALMLYNIIMSGEPNVNVTRIRILCFLGQISSNDLDLLEKEYKREAGNEEEGTEDYLDALSGWCNAVADPFFEVRDGKDGTFLYSISLTLTKCPYPHVIYEKNKVKHRLYAAADGLANVSLYELGTIFNLCESYLQNHDPATLHQLLGTVWREPKDATPENKKSGYNGDIRRPWIHEENMATRRAKHFEGVPDEIKQLMLFWLLSCRASIIREYPVIFDTETQSDPSDKNYGWGGVILQLANGPANVNQVAESRWGNVFLYLSMLEDDRKNRELEAARKIR